MIEAVTTPDFFRGITITMATVSMALFPGALINRIHGWRSILVAITVALLFAGGIANAIYRFGQPLRLFSSPLLFVASIGALTYVISIRGKQFWRDS